MHPEQAPLDGERQHAARLLLQPRHLPRTRLLGRNLTRRAGGHQALGENHILNWALMKSWRVKLDSIAVSLSTNRRQCMLCYAGWVGLRYLMRSLFTLDVFAAEKEQHATSDHGRKGKTQQRTQKFGRIWNFTKISHASNQFLFVPSSNFKELAWSESNSDLRRRWKRTIKEILEKY